MITDPLLSVHPMMEEFENETKTVHFGLCLRKTRAEKSNYYRDVSIFEKLRFRDGLA